MIGRDTGLRTRRGANSSAVFNAGRAPACSRYSRLMFCLAVAWAALLLLMHRPTTDSNVPLASPYRMLAGDSSTQAGAELRLGAFDRLSSCPSRHVPLVKAHAVRSADEVFNVSLPLWMAQECGENVLTVLRFRNRRTFPLEYCAIVAPMPSTSTKRPSCASHEECTTMCLQTKCCIGYMPRDDDGNSSPLYALASCRFYESDDAFNSWNPTSLYVLTRRGDARVAAALAQSLSLAAAPLKMHGFAAAAALVVLQGPPSVTYLESEALLRGWPAIFEIELVRIVRRREGHSSSSLRFASCAVTVVGKSQRAVQVVHRSEHRLAATGDDDGERSSPSDAWKRVEYRGVVRIVLEHLDGSMLGQELVATIGPLRGLGHHIASFEPVEVSFRLLLHANALRATLLGRARDGGEAQHEPVVDQAMFVSGVACGALLSSPNEFCLLSVAVEAVAAESLGDVLVAAPDADTFSPACSYDLADAFFAVEHVEGQGCVAVVAGSRAVMSPTTGQAVFTHLVVNLDSCCRIVFEGDGVAGNTAAASSNLLRAVLKVGMEQEDGAAAWSAMLNMTLPHVQMHALCTASHSDPSQTERDVSSVTASKESPDGNAGHQSARKGTMKSESPILVSIAAHECLECAVDLVRNIRDFVSPSDLVFHVAVPQKEKEQPIVTIPKSVESTWRARLSEACVEEVKGPWGQHRTTIFVNNQSIFTASGLRQLQVHALNILFVARLIAAAQRGDGVAVSYSHVLLVASNELYFRPGAFAYIKRFDCVHFGRASPLRRDDHSDGRYPAADAGLLFDHMRNPMTKKFLSTDEFDTPLSRPASRDEVLWQGVGPGAIKQDRWLARAMIGLGLLELPSRQVPLEGTFFNWSLALYFGHAMEAYFFPHTCQYCDDPTAYPTAEIILPTLFQRVCSNGNEDYSAAESGSRCGHRVSTMMWGNSNWEVDVDDVVKAVCSPFLVPFAFKRVPRRVGHPLREVIRRLQSERALDTGSRTWPRPEWCWNGSAAPSWIVSPS